MPEPKAPNEEEKSPRSVALADDERLRDLQDDDEDAEPDDDERDEELPAFTLKEATGALTSVFRFSLPYLLRYRAGLMAVGAGLLVETAFNVFMPLSLKFLIDDALIEGDSGVLVTILVSLAVAGLFTSVVAIWYGRRDAAVSAAVVADVRRDLFPHVQSLPASFFARSRRGDVLSRFSVDMGAFENAIRHLANTGLLPLLELVAGVILMLVLSWQLALVALLIFPIVLIGPRLVTPRALQASYEQKVREGDTLGTVQEVVSGQIVMQAFGLHRRMLGWFHLRNDNLRQTMGRATFFTTMVERTVTIAVLALHIIVLAIGAWLAYNESISIGTFVTFESAFWEISYNVAHLMGYIPTAIHASAAVRHMQVLLDEPGVAPDKPGARELPRLTSDIRFEKVDFRYQGSGEPVITDLDLVIPAGKRNAIVGPSGSGKSTLLNLMLRLHEPSGGRILIDGVDVADATRDSLRAQMAVVFQENLLFNTSIAENIRLGNENATDEEVERAAKAAEIHNFIRRLPRGYATAVGERGDTMSGGQRQRIAIARALVRDPAILLLDEATSALDQPTEQAIIRTLKRVSQGRTMVFVTHRIPAVVDMDEIIVMEAGRVVERGTHADLMAAGGLYRDLWHNQQHSPGTGDDEDDE